MLTEKEVQHIAKLVRIKLTGKEEDKFKKELSSILDYINKLNELDTENVEPLYQVTGLTNALREDSYRKDFKTDKESRDKFLNQAPGSENGFIKVKSILNKQ